MDNMIIKNITEKNIENVENKSQKEIQITLETTKQGNTISETITLTGNGSIKVLSPV